jgi:hypothetical protein
MRRLVLACFLMLPALPGAHPACAKTCTMDVVPAATLLLPYFEVDLKSATGRTTLMSIDNASDRAELAHVVRRTPPAIRGTR